MKPSLDRLLSVILDFLMRARAVRGGPPLSASPSTRGHYVGSRYRRTARVIVSRRVLPLTSSG